MAQKILYIINNMDWFWPHRVDLAQGAGDSGFDVHVVAKGAASEPKFAFYGFTGHEISNNPAGIILALRKIFTLEKPFIVHAITLKYAFLTGIAALLAPRTKLVFTIAGLGYLFSEEGAKLRAFTKPLLKLALRRARIIVQNPDDRDILIEGGFVKESQITLIRGSGVDLEKFRPTEHKSETPVVLMPSRLLRDKGIEIFIDAARILKKRGKTARFQLAGGPVGDNPRLISKFELQEMNADDAVEWLGHVSDMPALYSEATIIAYPSHYREGVPKVLLEAAASGKPIVTTNHPGCREAVKHGENGFLVPIKNPQALADAIEILLKDESLRERMGAAGRVKAENEFDVNLIVRRTLEVYDS